MKKTGFLLIGAAVLLGAFGITMPGANRTALMSAAGIFLVVGLLLALVGAYVESKRNSLIRQFQGMGGMPGDGGPQGMAELLKSMQAQAGTSDGMNFPAGMDRMDILKTVMQAQSDSNGDPDALAKILRERFGGNATFIEGGEATVFGAGLTEAGQPEVGGAADTISLLAQLSELHEKGVLSDQQFEEQKNRLLS